MRIAYYLEDDRNIQELMLTLLQLELPGDFRIKAFDRLAELKQAIHVQQPELLMVDLNVLDAGPKDVLSVIEEMMPAEIPVIICSGDVESVEPLQRNSRYRLFTKGANHLMLSDYLSPFWQTPAATVQQKVA